MIIWGLCILSCSLFVTSNFGTFNHNSTHITQLIHPIVTVLHPALILTIALVKSLYIGACLLCWRHTLLSLLFHNSSLRALPWLLLLNVISILIPTILHVSWVRKSILTTIVHYKLRITTMLVLCVHILSDCIFRISLIIGVALVIVLPLQHPSPLLI